MLLELDAIASGATSAGPYTVPVTPAVLRLFPLKKKWKEVLGLKEDWQGYNMVVYGWGRMFGHQHALVLLNREGDYHATWRLYVNGDLVWHMKDIVTQMGSGQDAQRMAESYFTSDKMQWIARFDQAMQAVLQRPKTRV